MLLSIVIPLLNEEASLRPLHQRLVQVTEKIGCDRQIIFIDDGSTDGSAQVIRELSAHDPTVVGIRFSRNFGHEAASTAGLDLASGDAAVLMDADLQDPPEIIEEMLQRWREGNQIVYAVRHKREGESLFKRSTSWLFYRMLHKLSNVPIPKDTGDFRLVDAAVLRALRRCRETDRFVRGLVAWTGFRSTSVLYDRPARHAGQTKYNPLRLFLLSLDAAIGFSILPLRIATAVGLVVTAVSLIMVCILIAQKLLHEMPMQGYALLATGMFFLGGVQMLLLGILGEYIGRIYRQSQARPLYLIGERIAAAPELFPLPEESEGVGETQGPRQTGSASHAR